MFNNYKSNWKIKNKTNHIRRKSGLNLLGHFELEDSIGNNESTFQNRNKIIYQKLSFLKFRYSILYDVETYKATTFSIILYCDKIPFKAWSNLSSPL